MKEKKSKNNNKAIILERKIMRLSKAKIKLYETYNLIDVSMENIESLDKIRSVILSVESEINILESKLTRIGINGKSKKA